MLCRHVGAERSAPVGGHHKGIRGDVLSGAHKAAAGDHRGRLRGGRRIRHPRGRGPGEGRGAEEQAAHCGG